MALTSEDLKNIDNIFSKRLKDAGLATKADLDRMEGRLVTSINLLQRDSFSRLDDHDARIRRLEEASSRS